MKKYISLLCLILWALCLQAQQGSIDPENPGDPSPCYALRINLSPEVGGTPNFTKKMIVAGDYVYVSIDLNKNFKLIQWVCGDSILTTNEDFYFQMPATDVTLTAQLQHYTAEFDPESPGDPLSPSFEHKYLVSAFVSPSVGGEVSPSAFYLKKGEQQTIYAYSESGYEFLGWFVDDQLESKNNPLLITMKDQDLSITAKFQFNPTSPNDPGVNAYDPSTGEVLIDRFRSGQLYEAMVALFGTDDWENENLQNVKFITIIGNMDRNDWHDLYSLYALNNLTILNLSQTTGSTAIPGESVCYNQNLRKIVLPAGIQKIESYSFYNNPNLEEIELYALVPPIVENYAFMNYDQASDGYVLPNMIIKVPASAIALYQAHDFWKQFPIYAIDANTSTLTVELPQNANGAKYKNMSLEIKNTQSGQVRKYIITDKTIYSFDNLFQGTTYEVSVKNSQGRNLGIKNVIITDNDTTIMLSQLKQLVDVSINVLSPNNENVTNYTRITWYDDKDNFIQTGFSLNNQIEGDILKYKIDLENPLVTDYKESDIEFDTITSENKTIQYQLEYIDKITFEGIIVDSINQVPIQNAKITIKQKIKGKYTKFFTTETNKDGKFSIDILDENDTEIVVSASNYLQQTFKKDNINDNGILYIKPFEGTKLNIKISYTLASKNGLVTTQDWYDNYSDLMFEIINLSKQDEKIDNYEYNHPQLFINQEISIGDTLQLIVNSASNTFANDTVSVMIGEYNRATINLDLVELAKLNVSYSNAFASDIVGLIYDNNNNKIVTKQIYINKKLSINHLVKGNYTLISIEQNNTLNSLSNISDYDEFNLIEDIHYTKTAISINNGEILDVLIDSIPSLKNWITYTNGNTSFTTNKTTVISGTYLTLRTQIDFLQQYKNDISNVEVVVNIPEGVSFVENALLIGSRIGKYTYVNNKVIVPLDKYNDVIRFCVIPTSEGDYISSAYIKFLYKGDTIQQPIGSVNYSVENATINAILKIAKKIVVAQGISIPNSDVELYDNDELIGITKVKPNGVWQIETGLFNPFNLSTHNIYAKIITPDNLKLQTKQKTFFYNISNSIELKTVEMSVFEHGQLHDKIVWDFENTTINKTYYQYTAADASFKFIVNFASDKNVKINGVTLNIYLHEGIYNLPLTYNSNIDRWEGNIPTGVMGGEGNGVINIGAEVDCRNNDEFLLDADWIHDIITAIREINNTKIETNIDDLLLTQFDNAINSNDEETINQILHTWYSDEILTVEDDFLLDEDLELLFDEVDDMLNDTSIIQDYLSEIQAMSVQSNMIITTCANIDSLQLLDDGYEVMNKTDQGKVYFYGSDEKLSIVDFDEDFYFEIKINGLNNQLLTTVNSLQTILYAAKRGDCYPIESHLAPIKKSIDDIKSKIEKIQGLWDGFVDVLKGLKFRAEENGKKLANKLNISPINQRKSILSKILDCQKCVAKWRNLCDKFELEKLGEKFPSMKNIVPKLGGALIGYDIVNNVLEEYNSLEKLNNLYKNIPLDCPKSQSVADGLANEICNYGEIIVYNTLEAVAWNIAQLTALAAELALAPETLGASTALVAINVILNITYTIRSTTNKLDAENKYYMFESRYRSLDCKLDSLPEKEPEDEDKDGKYVTIIESVFPDLEAHIDPAGYVYEAVSDNRVEGVKATVYYKESREDIFGNTITEDVMWNAWDYDQENPQYTDKNGQYQWFVPQGLWQVRFEKDGYEPAQSEWLPVPPPQLEVNIPIVQLTQPEVQTVSAFATAIDVTFNKYMQPAFLNKENIFVVANDVLVEGNIVFKNEMVSYEGEDSTYVSEIRFVPNKPFSAGRITLTISNRVRSYAGVNMSETYQQVFDVSDLNPLKQTESPTASIESGSTVETGTELYLNCSTPNAQIRYTLDGSDPTCNRGFIYIGEPIILTDYRNSIRAIACTEGYDPSQVSIFSYVIENKGDNDDVVVNVEYNNSIGISVYPTLVKDNIFIKSFMDIEKIVMYNINGQIMHTIVNPTNSNCINMESYPNGIYLLHIVQMQQSKVYKLVKTDF